MAMENHNFQQEGDVIKKKRESDYYRASNKKVIQFAVSAWHIQKQVTRCFTTLFPLFNVWMEFIPNCHGSLEVQSRFHIKETPGDLGCISVIYISVILYVYYILPFAIKVLLHPIIDKILPQQQQPGFPWTNLRGCEVWTHEIRHVKALPPALPVTTTATSTTSTSSTTTTVSSGERVQVAKKGRCQYHVVSVFSTCITYAWCMMCDAVR